MTMSSISFASFLWLCKIDARFNMDVLLRKNGFEKHRQILEVKIQGTTEIYPTYTSQKNISHNGKPEVAMVLSYLTLMWDYFCLRHTLFYYFFIVRGTKLGTRNTLWGTCFLCFDSCCILPDCVMLLECLFSLIMFGHFFRDSKSIK